ncbi:MAG TPA: chemotaxis protein CheB, partial [Vicinamibacterales bacterium]|nr:chemotaxis protein CheB [Vicinamibacterales bacterium]
MARAKHLVVIGASGGGIEALRVIVGSLDEDFPTPIAVVMHTSPQSPAVLDAILTRAGRLHATNAVNGERLRAGHIYVAPPDLHLVIEPGTCRVTKGPRENRFRPAIDPLFRSAAQVYGPGAIGVILSGSLDDGTDGLLAIKRLGGRAIVQDPLEALFPSMPQHAIENVDVDYILPLAEIGPLLARLTSLPVEAVIPEVPEQLQIEVKIAMEHNPLDAGLERVGTPSKFACPECHGVLFELREQARLKFRCHTGHAYSVASLLAAIGDGIEDSLWNSVRALDEGQLLMTRMAEHLRSSHEGADVSELLRRADEARRQAEMVRQLVMQR